MRRQRASLDGAAGAAVAADAAETERVLQYASLARLLVGHPRARVERYLDISDPLAGDEEDPSVLQRRSVWLAAAEFGDVFARVVGSPTDPLILYVHGSGALALRPRSQWRR